jgi:hypothetical protein
VGTEEAKLFKHGIHIKGLGTKVEISLQGLFDDGVMVAAMSKPVYTKFKEELGPLYPSERRLKMADGTITTPLGLWRGQIQIGTVEIEGEVEVFGENCGWEFLVGKPLLQKFCAVHDYTKDIIHIEGQKGQLTLFNTVTKQDSPNVTNNKGPSASGKTPPVISPVQQIETKITKALSLIDLESCKEPHVECGDIFPSLISLVNTETIFTRWEDPFKPECVEAILSAIKIGDDLTPAQRKTVQDTIRNYADCFALSLKEVLTAEDGIFTLNMPKDIPKFNLSVRQRPLT